MDFKKDIPIIKDVLTRGFAHIKPKPKIWIEVNEPAAGLDVWVISKGFAKMLLNDRYNFAFSIFDEKLDLETEGKIANLLIYTPKEMHYDIPWENPELNEDKLSMETHSNP
jgi:hypothetical protein